MRVPLRITVTGIPLASAVETALALALAAEVRKRFVSAVSFANSAEITGTVSPLGRVTCVVFVGIPPLHGHYTEQMFVEQ